MSRLETVLMNLPMIILGGFFGWLVILALILNPVGTVISIVLVIGVVMWLIILIEICFTNQEIKELDKASDEIDKLLTGIFQENDSIIKQIKKKQREMKEHNSEKVFTMELVDNMNERMRREMLSNDELVEKYCQYCETPGEECSECEGNPPSRYVPEKETK